MVRAGCSCVCGRCGIKLFTQQRMSCVYGAIGGELALGQKRSDGAGDIYLKVCRARSLGDIHVVVVMRVCGVVGVYRE